LAGPPHWSEAAAGFSQSLWPSSPDSAFPPALKYRGERGEVQAKESVFDGRGYFHLPGVVRGRHWRRPDVSGFEEDEIELDVRGAAFGLEIHPGNGIFARCFER
jgi:hypothetical protein